MRSWKPRGKMPLEEQVWLLSMVEIFDPLSKEELEEMGRRAPEYHIGKGEIFYTPEDRGERLLILKKGRAGVYEVSPEGEELVLSVAESGTILGEMALTGQRLRRVYVKALEPSTVCTLHREDLEHIILTKPEVGLRLVRYLTGRLRETEMLLGELVHKDVTARLASLILRLVESEGVVSHGGDYEVLARYTHDQLAKMIGSKRVPVSRAFAKLKAEGILKLEARRIHVTNLEALKSIAEAEGPPVSDSRA